MLKKTIKYKDLDGNERVGDFYFHFFEAELTEMEYGTTGRYSTMLESIANAQDIPSIMKVFKEIILRSYGVKAPDGIQFEKSEEISRRFMQSDAYNVLFMELIQDPKKFADFCNALLPDDLKAKIAEMKKKETSTGSDAQN